MENEELSEVDQAERLEKIVRICKDQDFIKEVAMWGCAEPGYSDPETAFVLGDWNSDKKDVADKLEKLGCELIWLDEWELCDFCRKVFRIKPDSYSWTPSYWLDEDSSFHCIECIIKDPKEYVESKIGKDRECITIEHIDLIKLGFTRLHERLENGLHEGQAADPVIIASNLRKQGIDRFVFMLDGSGQFDVYFSVWVDAEQLDRSNLGPDGLDDTQTNAPESPAEVMRKALQSIPPMSDWQNTDGIQVTKIGAGGNVTTKIVSREDFIAGKALDD